MKYKFLLSMNHGNETLISDERSNDHFIEISLAKPGDWDNEDWHCNPTNMENEEVGPTGTAAAAIALNDSDIEASSPLPTYLRLQWGPTAEYQALFRCNLPTLSPEDFEVELHRLGPGLEDEHPRDISIYARSLDHGDEIILDDNGIALLVVFIEYSGGGGSRYGARTRAYAKRTVSEEVPGLSSGEIGRMLGPWRRLLRNATIEEGWMELGVLESSADPTM